MKIRLKGVQSEGRAMDLRSLSFSGCRDVKIEDVGGKVTNAGLQILQWTVTGLDETNIGITTQV
jgi:hypothetical protein